jgi:hypothetical protein
MTTSKPDLEEALEQETIALFAELQWETADCFDETFGSQAGASVQRPYIGRDNNLAGLPPEGLFLRTFADTQEEADDLLKKTTRWSARGRGSSGGHSLRQYHRPDRVHPGRHRRRPLPARSLFWLRDCLHPAETVEDVGQTWYT